MTSHDISLQRFEVEPLGIKDLKVWKRSPVELMTDMLQDPDYTDKIDWSGASPSLPGVYTSVTSGDWFKEVKVINCHIISPYISVISPDVI